MTSTNKDGRETGLSGAAGSGLRPLTPADMTLAADVAYDLGLRHGREERDVVIKEQAGVIRELYWLVIKHHECGVMRDEHNTCPICGTDKVSRLLNQAHRLFTPNTPVSNAHTNAEKLSDHE